MVMNVAASCQIPTNSRIFEAQFSITLIYDTTPDFGEKWSVPVGKSILGRNYEIFWIVIIM